LSFEERVSLIEDDVKRFPNITDEELERIGCMRVQYLATSREGNSIEVFEWFETIPTELLSKNK
jgi:hypothetical protein